MHTTQRQRSAADLRQTQRMHAERLEPDLRALECVVQEACALYERLDALRCDAYEPRKALEQAQWQQACITDVVQHLQTPQSQARAQTLRAQAVQCERTQQAGLNRLMPRIAQVQNAYAEAEERMREACTRFHTAFEQWKRTLPPELAGVCVERLEQRITPYISSPLARISDIRSMVQAVRSVLSMKLIPQQHASRLQPEALCKRIAERQYPPIAIRTDIGSAMRDVLLLESILSEKPQQRDFFEHRALYKRTAWLGDAFAGLALYGNSGADGIRMPYFLVHPARRRQGVGTQLMHHVMQRSLGNGRYRLQTTINPHNEEGDAFLRSCGFRTQQCAGDDCIMEYALDTSDAAS